MLKALSLGYAVETFLSALLSSLVLKAIKKQKKLGSVLMTIQRFLYVVYIYTPIHTFYQQILAWNFNTIVPEYTLPVVCACPNLCVLPTFDGFHRCRMQLGAVDE